MQYDALMAGHLFAGQMKYFQDHGMGKTFEFKLLGRVNLFTLDPKNMEAIFITNFEGETSILPNFLRR